MKDRICKICEDILKISDEDIMEVRDIANKQKEYFNPLKMATTEWQHGLGEYNDKVLDALIALKKELEVDVTLKDN